VASSLDPRIVWATHPRHLPPAPGGRVVVVDVAFAAGRGYVNRTRPFLDKLGDRLLLWVDHHVHREGWAEVEGDPRFLLVPNREAHACPELITPELVTATEGGQPADAIVAHADFDGMLAAVKWRNGGRSPYPEADEDARAVDSPGRGHSLSARGARLAYAVEEARAVLERDAGLVVLTRIAASLLEDEETLGLEAEIDSLAARAQEAEHQAREEAEVWGSEEADGVFVVRAPHPLPNRVRKYLLVYGEERARVGALYEPDPQGGAWVTAATFDESLDLEEVKGFEGGRSDYRFARAKDDGRGHIRALGAYVASR
jgi:hypothetical protein